MGVVEPMGLKKGSVYTFIVQLILIYLIVLLFLLVMLVIIGNAPVLILFTAPGIFLSSSNHLFLDLSILSPRQVADIQEIEQKLVVHIANL